MTRLADFSPIPNVSCQARAKRWRIARQGAQNALGLLPLRALPLLAIAALSLAARPAQADFPYARPGADESKYEELYLNAGQVPADRAGKEEWMYAATPDDPGTPPDPLIAANNANPLELGGVRGAHIVDEDAAAATAWQVTAGRPDVRIAVLDSGIRWDERSAMENLRFKTALNAGELPAPRNDGGPPLVAGEDCSPAGPYDEPGDDLNDDGVFNLRDFSCDARIDLGDPRRVGPDGFLVPQDLLIAFSDGNDADANGYDDDVVGWDFLDDDNDPFDDVAYGHGTGEAEDSVAEAEHEDGVGTCPNCMAFHMRVGDSFVADVNRFAAAVTYATDNGALVVQEALGTLNNSRLARDAVEYAYRHGVTVIASAADEAAQHNNWPSSLPHVVLVNSVTRYDETLTPASRSYLAFNGCTNFNAKITVAIPSVSCSSDATGRGAGIAGLVYAAALNAIDRRKLDAHPRCRLATDGPDTGSEPDACPISANEVRQLMASGTIGGAQLADDVDFAPLELSCAPVPAPGCTDPFLAAPPARPVVSPVATTQSYPARGGHDQFYGYGRVNVARPTRTLVPAPLDDPGTRSTVPPEVEITSPQWFDQIDPEGPTVAIEGEVFARGSAYACRVYVAPGHYPNNGSNPAVPAGDFEPVGGGACDGSARTGPVDGVLATIDPGALRSRFPAGTSFDGAQPVASVANYAGRPNKAPNGLVVRVVAETQSGGRATTGEDRRALYLHRDQDMLAGFPRKLPSDGESSPVLVDLDGDNRNELVVATQDGIVHAYRRDPATGAISELPGWPVRGDPPAFVTRHSASPAYASGAVPTDLGGGILTAVAAADADRNGAPEVYAADLEGKVYGWSAAGERVFEAEANPDWSGRPLAPFENVRQGPRNRTQHGFLGSPALADLDRDDGGRLEVVAAAMDRHVYAWNHDGTPVPGFPVLVVDPAKVKSVDPATHAVTFRDDAGAPLDQGGIVDTPAVADIAGDERPEIIVGTNEEYRVDDGTEGPLNVAPSSSPLLELLKPLDLLDFANGRVYAISPDGDPDAPASGASPFLAGWPVPIGIVFAELLPIVGEGINGSPVVAPLTCPEGGAGPKIGTMPAAGPAYILNEDGTSCYGREGGLDRTLNSDVSAAADVEPTALPALGLPAFGDLGGEAPAFVAPVAGVIRALDVVVNEYQLGGQDFVAAWDPTSGLLRPGFPSPVNDLQFLTGPAVADVGGSPGEEIVAGTASMDLVALSAAGLPTSAAWPKLTTDWTVATPTIGSFGTLDIDPDTRKVVVSLTRSGYLNAYETGATGCAPASSPRFHHDNASSGDFRRDAVLPGRPSAGAVGARTISFTAPGDDLLCGSANRYEIVTSSAPIDERSFDDAEPLAGAPEPEPAGAEQSYAVPAEARRHVAIRAVDEQGNVGRPLVVDLGAAQEPPRSPPHGSPGGGEGPSCANRIAGTPGKDSLKGTPGADRINGRDGPDRIRARGGGDCVRGGRGADLIRSGSGSDTVRCGPGEDVAYVGRRDRTRDCEAVR